MEPKRFRPDQPPVVVITGVTGSGKSALAVALARRFNGEIIAADSRTVYKGMNIGTAKPTAEERQGIPHHGFDVVEPGQQFTAYDFQQLAYKAVADIVARGNLPIIVGGTGLYIDAFLYDFQFRPRPGQEMRAALQQLAIDDLQKRVQQAGLPMPANARNPRHLARLLESGTAPSQPREIRQHTLVLGLSVSQGELRRRIEQRVEAMFAAGLIEEVSGLVRRYGDSEALRAPGYKAVAAYLRGDISRSAAKQQFIIDDMRLAKRQRTWFRRNKDIRWLHAPGRLDQAAELVSVLLGR